MLTHASSNRQIKIYIFFILLMYSCYIVQTTNIIKNNLQGDPEYGIFITRKTYTFQKSYYSHCAHEHIRTCKAVPVHAMKAYKERRGIPPLILNSVLHGDTLSFLSSRRVNDQVSHPYKTTGKIIFLYIYLDL